MESTRSTLQINTTVNSTVRRVIFFDGHCNLCNRWVDFLLRVLRARSKKSAHFSIQLASLQGITAKEILVAAGRGDLLAPPLNTVVLYERVAGTVGESKFFTESDAILKVFEELGSFWSWLAVFRFIPKSIRDGIYRYISKNRFRWFGKRETCRLPTPEERTWLLD
jgi:predicted DCC family thiol-disulfide oxidoreductase YuxK